MENTALLQRGERTQQKRRILENIQWAGPAFPSGWCLYRQVVQGKWELLTNLLSSNSLAFLSFREMSVPFPGGVLQRQRMRNLRFPLEVQAFYPPLLSTGTLPAQGCLRRFGISRDLIHRHCGQLFSFEVMIHNLGEMTLMNIFRIQVRA